MSKPQDPIEPHPPDVRAPGSVAYEVNLWVDAAIADAYRAWLDRHVQAILALPGFIDARIGTVLEPAAGDGRIALCVHYRLRDMAALQAYLDRDAQRMRADGQARFGGRFRASRRIIAY